MQQHDNKGVRTAGVLNAACDLFACAREDLDARPALYSVWLVAERNTSLSAVVHTLRHGFHCAPERAMELALDVINHGKAICCTMPRDIAETKAEEVARLSAEILGSASCVLHKECVSADKKD